MRSCGCDFAGQELCGDEQVVSIFAATAGAELEPITMLSSLLWAVAGTQAPLHRSGGREGARCVFNTFCVWGLRCASHIHYLI